MPNLLALLPGRWRRPGTDTLSQYLDGLLGPRREGQVARYLARSGRSRAELESLRVTVGLLRRTPQADLPRSFIFPAAPTAPVVEPPRRLHGVPSWACAAAGASLALLLAIVVSADMVGVLQGDGWESEAEEAAMFVEGGGEGSDLETGAKAEPPMEMAASVPEALAALEDGSMPATVTAQAAVPAATPPVGFTERVAEGTEGVSVGTERVAEGTAGPSDGTTTGTEGLGIEAAAAGAASSDPDDSQGADFVGQERVDPPPPAEEATGQTEAVETGLNETELVAAATAGAGERARIGTGGPELDDALPVEKSPDDGPQSTGVAGVTGAIGAIVATAAPSPPMGTPMPTQPATVGVAAMTGTGLPVPSPSPPQRPVPTLGVVVEAAPVPTVPVPAIPVGDGVTLPERGMSPMDESTAGEGVEGSTGVWWRALEGLLAFLAVLATGLFYWTWRRDRAALRNF